MSSDNFFSSENFLGMSFRSGTTCLMFTQFEEGNILTEICNYAESGDESNDNSIMPPLISEEEMDVMDSCDESEDESISTDMLEDIRYGSKSHPRVNRREARYKIYDCIKQIQLE